MAYHDHDFIARHDLYVAREWIIHLVVSSTSKLCKRAMEQDFGRETNNLSLL